MTQATVARIARHVSLLGCGMLAGIAVTVLFLELALRRLSGPEYVRVRQAEFTVFTRFIGAVFVPTLIAVAMLALQERRRPVARRPEAVALALLLLALAISLAVNGPINVEQLSRHAQTPPADWAQLHDRWQIAHAVRTAAIALAFGRLGAAAAHRDRIDVPF
ncbi:anthrone oxygenase family protein [Streptomyces sp. NPDC047043]|uniref:anthrone oxygenase family protein n=1 Tax=Streptomyces sp. NPDC047043 TaxID=3154497 RepID=UPI0033F48F68